MDGKVGFGDRVQASHLAEEHIDAVDFAKARYRRVDPCSIRRVDQHTVFTAYDLFCVLDTVPGISQVFISSVDLLGLRVVRAKSDVSILRTEN